MSLLVGGGIGRLKQKKGNGRKKRRLDAEEIIKMLDDPNRDNMAIKQTITNSTFCVARREVVFFDIYHC